MFLKNLEKKCIEMYGLDPSYFYSAPGLAWQAYLKRTEVKLELVTDYQMLLILKKELEAECVNLHIDMLKQIINT